MTPELRDECLNGEIFYSLQEAQIVIEQWRQEYNTRRPRSALVGVRSGSWERREAIPFQRRIELLARAYKKGPVVNSHLIGNPKWKSRLRRAGTPPEAVQRSCCPAA